MHGILNWHSGLLWWRISFLLRGSAFSSLSRTFPQTHRRCSTCDVTHESLPSLQSPSDVSQDLWEQFRIRWSCSLECTSLKSWSPSHLSSTIFKHSTSRRAHSAHLQLLFALFSVFPTGLGPGLLGLGLGLEAKFSGLGLETSSLGLEALGL